MERTRRLDILKSFGRVGSLHPTDRPMAGVYYQTGQHGPQNGFAILFVEVGNHPEQVERVVINRHWLESIQHP
jgi:hypothetical protein